MAEVVDSIIAELILRDNGYTKGVNDAIATNKRLHKSIADLQAFGAAPPARYADSFAKAAASGVTAHEQAATKIKRARKSQTDDSLAQDARATASAKKAAKDQADAAIAEARRVRAENKRFADLADRAVAGRAVPQAGPGSRIGRTVANEASGQRSIPASVLNGGVVAEVAAEREINHLLADRFDLAARAAVAEGAIKREMKDELELQRRITTYKRAGLADDAAILRAETEILAVARLRAETERKQAAAKSVRGVASGLGLGAGGGAAIGAFTAASVIAGTAALVSGAIAHAKALKVEAEQLGITTTQLQVYRVAAENVGVTNEQLRTAFGQLASNLGRAQSGAEQQSKAFKALGIDIGNAQAGFKSTNDILPTLIERLSSIKNPARRAAIETALLGEEGRKLDGLLSGGIASINKLAEGMERAGAALSPAEIKALDDAALAFARVKNQLQVDISKAVYANRDALSSLAGALLQIAVSAGKAVEAYSRFTNLRIRASDNYSVADRVSAQSELLQTKGGRVALINDLSSKIDANNAQRSNPASKEKLGQYLYRTVTGGRNAENDRLDREYKRLVQERDSVIKQDRAADRLDAAGKGKPVQDGAVNQKLLDSLNAPKPAKGPKGKSAEQIEAERLDRDRRFTADEQRAHEERLSLLSDLTADTRQQDQYARERINTERDARDREITDEAAATISRQKLSGAEAALVNSRRDQLIKLNDENADLALRKVNRDEAARYEDQALNDLRTATGIQTDILSTQLQLARTVAERKEIELRLLKIAADQERADLQKLIDSKQTDPADLPSLIAKRDAIGARTDAQAKVIDQQNAGPLEKYRRSFDDPATQVEQAVADRLREVDEGITDAVAAKLGVKDPLLKQLLKIFLEQNILAPLYDAISGAKTGASGGGGFFGDLISAAGSVFGGARADGGPVQPGKAYLVGERGPEIATFGAHGNITPNHQINVAASNQRINAATPQITVLAPRHYDLSNSLIDRNTLAQMNAENRDFAIQLNRASSQQTLRQAGAQVAGIMQRKQTLG